MWHYITCWIMKVNNVVMLVFFSLSVPIDGENSGLYVDLYVNWPKSTLLSGRLGY